MFADLHNTVFIPLAFIVIGAVVLVVVCLQNRRLDHAGAERRRDSMFMHPSNDPAQLAADVESFVQSKS